MPSIHSINVTGIVLFPVESLHGSVNVCVGFCTVEPPDPSPKFHPRLVIGQGDDEVSVNWTVRGNGPDEGVAVKLAIKGVAGGITTV